MKIYMYLQTQMSILSRRPILLTILMYDQFIHLTQINTVLSTQQHAKKSFFVTSWFYSVCVTVVEKNIYMNLNYSYSTTIYDSIFAQMYISGRKKIFFAIFAYNLFHDKKQNL